MKLFLISPASNEIVEERKKGREGGGSGERRQEVEEGGALRGEIGEWGRRSQETLYVDTCPENNQCINESLLVFFSN